MKPKAPAPNPRPKIPNQWISGYISRIRMGQGPNTTPQSYDGHAEFGPSVFKDELVPCMAEESPHPIEEDAEVDTPQTEVANPLPRVDNPGE